MKKKTLLPALLLARHACLWAALGLLTLLAFAPLPARAAVTEAWVHRYSNVVSNSTDQASKVVVDAAGDIIVTGTTDGDMLTIKYSGADGSVLWLNRYNGPANGYDFPSALAVDGSGNVVVTGYSYAPNYRPDYYTAKYAAADGALLWEKRYNGPANSEDQANAVVVDGSGNVVVTGSSQGDYYTAKYAAVDGALLWEKRYNGPANHADGANAVAVDGSGNVVVTGYSYNTNSNADYYTAKYAAADGALLWEQRYNRPANNNDSAQAVAVDSSGNVVVTGYEKPDGGGADYYTAKYAAADGALLWEKRYTYGQATAVAVDGSGNVVVTGNSDVGVGSDYYTAKYAAADGALLWEKRYNGLSKSYNEARVVVVDGSGSVVVTGYSEGSGGSGDYYTAKYAAADGALLWEQRYNGAANGDDQARAMALDSNGNVVVTGYSSGTNGFADYYTAKYAAADGALLWEKRYTNGNASAVAVDGSGNVVVTGSSATIKYLANGTEVWTNIGGSTALALDASGNVVVTGASFTTNGTSDYYTAKYGAADGALLWEQRYNGPADWYDFASAVTVDGSGNVVVTGNIGNSDEGYDYYTAKYVATDGALLWEQRHSYGLATAVAVDGSGNVVVTGGSYNTNGDSEYYTAKYAAADGALLWEKRYNGPANGEDWASSLALGPNGMVAVTGSSSGDYATVVYRDDVYPISIALVPGGIRLRFSGIPGRSYTIERAPAVSGPWTTLNTQTAPASGLLEYLDVPTPSGSAFYRTAQP